jgi:thiamine-monophosphate kinase
LTTPGKELAADIGERRLIERIHERLPPAPASLVVGIGDDAAVAALEPGTLQVLTTDALVEGVHFDRRFSSCRDIGFKALAVNISDIAAMGGASRLALLSLMLPDGITTADLDALVDGVAELAKVVGVTVAGGNVSRSPGPLVVDVALVGTVKRRRILRRNGGKPGDVLYVSGSVGSATAGLGWLRAQARDAEALPSDPGLAECVVRHRRPEPRARLGSLLGRTRAASACTDLSDGLAAAVRGIALASGAGARVIAAEIPIQDAASTWLTSHDMDPMLVSMTGGEDYELLFSVPKRTAGRLKTVRRQAPAVQITRIGMLTDDSCLVVERNGRLEPLPEGFHHF